MLTPEQRRTLLAVARTSLTRAAGGNVDPVPGTDDPVLHEPGAAFVTLRRRGGGELRGCVGEWIATRPLLESVAHSAVSAGMRDPRFPPVALEEIPLLRIEINVLSPAHPIAPEDVEVGRHGLLISYRGRRGLLLPEVPVDLGWSREEFLDGLCEKAGLPHGTWRLPGAELLAFEAEIFEETE